MRKNIFLLFIFFYLNITYAGTFVPTDCISALSGTNDTFSGSEVEFVDMEISSEEQSILSGIQITKTTQYNRFGALELLRPELEAFLRNELLIQDPKAIEIIVSIVERASSKVLRTQKKDSAWITLRAFTPTNEYDEPRWHTDGSFYSSLNQQRKFAGVLKGSSTLFAHLTSDERIRFDAIEQDSGLTEVRKRRRLAELLKAAQMINIPQGHGALFAVGKPLAAVHSEPSISSGRLFFSVLPGTKHEIEELTRRWDVNSQKSPSPTNTSILNLGPQYISEYQEACLKDGGRTWGQSLCVPMIFVNREDLNAVANHPDPDGKFQKVGEFYQGVYLGPKLYANTTLQWGDQTWSMVLWPLPEEKASRRQLMLHEAFHSIQKPLMSKHFLVFLKAYPSS